MVELGNWLDVKWQKMRSLYTSFWPESLRPLDETGNQGSEKQWGKEDGEPPVGQWSSFIGRSGHYSKYGTIHLWSTMECVLEYICFSHWFVCACVPACMCVCTYSHHDLHIEARGHWTVCRSLFFPSMGTGNQMHMIRFGCKHLHPPTEPSHQPLNYSVAVFLCHCAFPCSKKMHEITDL